MEPKYFDLNTASNIIGVSPMTLRRAIKSNKITYKIITDNFQRKYMLSYEDIDNYIRYAAQNNIYELNIIKTMKDKLEKHQIYGESSHLIIKSQDIEKNEIVRENKEEISPEQNQIPQERVEISSSSNHTNELIELFKEQEKYANQKIESYKEKLENSSKEITDLKILNKEYEQKIINKSDQLETAQKILTEELTFIKLNVIENLKLIKESCLKINDLMIKPEPVIPIKIYMDIL